MDERIASLEDRINSIQVSLDVLPDVLTRCIQQQFEVNQPVFQNQSTLTVSQPLQPQTVSPNLSSHGQNQGQGHGPPGQGQGPGFPASAFQDSDFSSLQLTAAAASAANDQPQHVVGGRQPQIPHSSSQGQLWANQGHIQSPSAAAIAMSNPSWPPPQFASSASAVATASAAATSSQSNQIVNRPNNPANSSLAPGGFPPPSALPPPSYQTVAPPPPPRPTVTKNLTSPTSMAGHPHSAHHAS